MHRPQTADADSEISSFARSPASEEDRNRGAIAESENNAVVTTGERDAVWQRLIVKRVYLDRPRHGE